MYRSSIISTYADLLAFMPYAYAQSQVECKQLADRLSAIDAHKPQVRLRVDVIGRFKTGKSHLLNTLIGHEVLPYNTDECTSHITYLQYAEALSAAELFIRSGKLKSKPIDYNDFRCRSDLTKQPKTSGMPSNPVNTTGFIVNVPSRLLQKVLLVDTPGYDGSGVGSRERAQKAIDRVLSEAGICMLVVTWGLTEDDLPIIRRIHETGRELFIVFNMSDNYDAEQAEDVKRSALTALQKKIGISPAWFTVSALWQSATPAGRASILQQENRRYVEEDPINEWPQLLDYIDRQKAALVTEAHRKHLVDIANTYALVCTLDSSYDRTAQAAVAFVSNDAYYQNFLTQAMPPPMGPTHLKQARDAACAGRALNWRVLANYDISPDDLAPRMCLAEGIGSTLIQRYIEAANNLLDTLMHQGDHKQIERDVLVICQFISKCEKYGTALQVLSDKMEWARWCCKTTQADFAYASTFDALKSRWKRTAEYIASDTAQIRQQLSDALQIKSL